MRKVHIVHWRPGEATQLVERVRAAGFAVNYCEDPSGPAITQAVRDYQPDIVVIDLSRLPSHGKEVAVWLRGRKATRHIPIVFTGGDPAKVAKIQEILPDAVFTVESKVVPALKSAPAEVLQPVVPAPMMQRYQDRTPAQKMGIREGSKVGVMNPPRDYLTVLGNMPPDVDLAEDPGSPQDVTLWFVHEPEPFFAALPRMRSIATRTKLWVLWKKGSKDGITQNFIRKTAIDAGLVDYKICSVDGHWSGIAFARSKA
jgi:CheY-like chemotaxis protein